MARGQEVGAAEDPSEYPSYMDFELGKDLEAEQVHQKPPTNLNEPIEETDAESAVGDTEDEDEDDEEEEGDWWRPDFRYQTDKEALAERKREIKRQRQL